MLHDTTAFIIDTIDTGPWLPDPGPAAGREHVLVNSALVDVTWTIAGGGSFNTSTTLSPLLATTLLIPSGRSWRVLAESSWWRSSRPPQHTEYLTGLTDATGRVHFTFAVPFAEPPIVLATTTSNGGPNGTWTEIESCTASSCTVRVWTGLDTQRVIRGGNTTGPVGAGVRVNVSTTA